MTANMTKVTVALRNFWNAPKKNIRSIGVCASLFFASNDP